jgi:hypothetical protein
MKMLGKLMDLLSLFRKGSEVANPEIWHKGSDAVSVIVPFVMAAVKVAGDYGYGIQLTADQAMQIALGVIAAIQFVVRNFTSKHAGILPAEPTPKVVPSDEPAKAAEPLQGEHEANAQTPGIGDDTRERAAAYLRDNKLFDERG